MSPQYLGDATSDHTEGRRGGQKALLVGVLSRAGNECLQNFHNHQAQ